MTLTPAQLNYMDDKMDNTMPISRNVPWKHITWGAIYIMAVAGTCLFWLQDVATPIAQALGGTRLQPGPVALTLGALAITVVTAFIFSGGWIWAEASFDNEEFRAVFGLFIPVTFSVTGLTGFLGSLLSHVGVPAIQSVADAFHHLVSIL